MIRGIIYIFTFLLFFIGLADFKLAEYSSESLLKVFKDIIDELMERETGSKLNETMPTAISKFYNRNIGLTTAPNVKLPLLDRAHYLMSLAKSKALVALHAKIKEEAVIAQRFKRGFLKNAFDLVQHILNSKPTAHKMSLPAFLVRNTSLMLMQDMGLYQKDTDLWNIITGSASQMFQDRVTLFPDDPLPNLAPDQCPWPIYRCDSTSRFRSYDGSCNNLDNPMWGRSLRPFKRYQQPQYGDGMSTLRHSISGKELPSARLVSYTLHEDKDRPHHINTVMLMQWGQFTDHELVHTPLTKIMGDEKDMGRAVDLECGNDGCQTEHEACSPISIPVDDPVFGKAGHVCLMFVRSQEVPNINCTLGPREQMNQVTPYIDGSMIYGSTKEENDKLRDDSYPARGKMKMTAHPTKLGAKMLLPTTKFDKGCADMIKTQRCFLAGDERVNEHAALTTMHTMWVREHNRIEEKLSTLNPQWNGKRLYEETRKIVGAMIQHIVYDEFLPLVIGRLQMQNFGLTLMKYGYFEGYNKSVEATSPNVFATAAFRFGHSVLPAFIKLASTGQHYSLFAKKLRLSQTFFRPIHLYNDSKNGLDSFIQGMVSEKSQNIDSFVTEEVTQHLFAEDPPDGLGTDLISLNIQRGRDHGIPGYTSWRKFCGLSVPSSFDDLEDINKSQQQKMKSIYSHVDDIDLFPAGISENSVDGAMLGPTFSCIIGKYFHELRVGDRFWFENNGLQSFSPAQLQEIRKSSLARIFCDNGDGIKVMQPLVMELPFREAYPTMNPVGAKRHGLSMEWFIKLWLLNYNKRVDCSCIPEVDLTKWKDKKQSNKNYGWF